MKYSFNLFIVLFIFSALPSCKNYRQTVSICAESFGEKPEITPGLPPFPDDEEDEYVDVIETESFDASPEAYSFIVPDGVETILIRGCSGANGGAGGGASGSVAINSLGHDNLGDLYGADGGNSGTVNGLQLTFGETIVFRGSKIGTGGYMYPWNIYSASQIQNGQDGGLGLQSILISEDKTLHAFSLAAPLPINPLNLERCVGGQNGLGGENVIGTLWGGRVPFKDLDPQKYFASGSGATNTHVPWSSLIEEKSISVIPGQIIKIYVGVGGTGGQGGQSEYLTSKSKISANDYLGDRLLDGKVNNNTLNAGWRGIPGTAGTPGTDGFVTIQWTRRVLK